jgi:hypothetical protein
MAQIPDPNMFDDLREWASQIQDILIRNLPGLDNPFETLPSHSVAELTSALVPATQPGQLVYCHDATGGVTLAFSDGTIWRRASDLTVIS